MNKEDMLALAAVNKLALSEAEQERNSQYLNFALSKLDKMAKLDTAGIEPLVYCVDENSVFREDQVIKTLSREQILANAPAQSEGCFRVPKVVE